MIEQVVTIKNTDVTDCLKFFLTLHGIYTIDDDDYVCDASGNREATAVDGVEKNIQLYRSVIKDDVVVVNPFFEGQNAAVQNGWFYNRLYGSFIAALMYHIFNDLLKVALEQKTLGKKAPKVPLNVVKTISCIADEVDEKMLTEFEHLMESPDRREIFSIYYRAPQKLTVVSSGLFGDLKVFDGVSIRKKTLGVFAKLLQSILGLKDTQEITKYAVKASPDIACPKLESYFRCLYGLYFQINELAEALGHEPVNLDIMGKHIENIKDYHTLAKWQKTVQIPDNQRQELGANQMTGVRPAMTASGIPIPDGQQQQPQMPVASYAMTASGIPCPPGTDPGYGQFPGQYNQGFGGGFNNQPPASIGGYTHPSNIQVSGVSVGGIVNGVNPSSLQNANMAFGGSSIFNSGFGSTFANPNSPFRL